MQILRNYLEKIGIEYTDDMIEKFSGYMDGILEWNEKINLTAITDRDEFVTKHFVDSVLGVNLPEYKDAASVIDVGTGGGFPGIPLAIVSPDKRFILADSLKKRLKVIDDLADKNSIDNVETVHGRAEELARKKEYRDTFDVCVSRAVANLSVLLEYCLPFIRVGGCLMAYKGPDAEKEIAGASNALKALGGEVVRTERVSLDCFDHNIVIIKKTKPTPKKYPRKAGTPSKEPL